MTTIAKPRCSSLDRIFACPGSLLDPDPGDGQVFREAGGPDAVLGTAKHEALSCIPRGREPPIEEIAARHGVPVDDLEIAVRLGRQAWDEIGVYFPGAFVERRVESSVCRGTLDFGSAVCVGPELSALRVGDWKTGWGTVHHPKQLRGYALCAVQEFGFPANGVVTIYEIWTAHRQKHVENLTESDLRIFEEELGALLATAESSPCRLEYRSGAHCTFCPRRSTCVVREQWLRESVTGLVGVDHGLPITPEVLGEIYSKYQTVKRAVGHYEKALESALDDGPVPLPDGRRLERVESEREKISMGPAIRAMIEAGLICCVGDGDEIKGDLPKSALSKWAGRVAERGGKAKLLRDVYGVLREAGALRTEPHRSKRVVEPPEKVDLGDDDDPGPGSW